MKVLFLLMIGLLGMAVPGMSWAADGVINPSNGNAWDLYVFGNGKAVYHIFMGIKMLMMPDAGHTGFLTLLLLMATLGFLVMAISAGFNPGKNFIPMFGYILVCWVVTWSSTKLSVNLNITDMVVNSEGFTTTQTVANVPALVALPAALTSQVGHYFTGTLETYMSLPNEYLLSKGSVGQFNLFAKMTDDMSRIRFTDGNLKLALSAYITDCAVPAIAMGNLFYSDGKIVLYGNDAILRSPNLMQTLESAQHNSILTKGFVPSATAPAKVSGGIGDGKTSEAMGTLMPCKEAYAQLKTQMEENTNGIMAKASSSEMGGAGVLAPYETLFRTMIAEGNSGTYGNANGLVMQSALVNGMSGAFQLAAMQTGNNEVLMAANLTQAEQNQKTSWVAGFHTFNNMMGYVFTVLQAFIFAITPMIVVALLIPGMGKSIFVNYAQILVWLTLWEPMLAVVNFVITLFAMEGIQQVVAQNGGISVATTAAISERTSNAMVAAQFLGTMTPMISWGIVKGAMAFTEFISAGVGTQFATQAAAQAASGGYQAGAISMNNTAMNSHNTAMSASVGAQNVQAFTNAGAALVTHGAGGTTATIAGQAVSNTSTVTSQAAAQHSANIQKNQMLSEALQHSNTDQEVISKIKSHSDTKTAQSLLSDIHNQTVSQMMSNGATRSQAVAFADGLMHGDTQQQMGQAQLGMKVGIGGKPGSGGGMLSWLPSIGADASRTTSASQTDVSSATSNQQFLNSHQASEMQQTAAAAGQTRSVGNSQITAISNALTTSGGHSFSSGFSSVVGAVATTTYSEIQQFVRAEQHSTTSVMPAGSSFGSLGAHSAAAGAVQGQVDSGFGSVSPHTAGTPTNKDSMFSGHVAQGAAQMAPMQQELAGAGVPNVVGSGPMQAPALPGGGNVNVGGAQAEIQAKGSQIQHGVDQTFNAGNNFLTPGSDKANVVNRSMSANGRGG